MGFYYKVAQKLTRGYRSAIVAPSFSLEYAIGERCECPQDSLGIFVFTDLTEARKWQGQNDIPSLVVLAGSGARAAKQPHWLINTPRDVRLMRKFYRDSSPAYIKNIGMLMDLWPQSFPVSPSCLGGMPDGAVALRWFMPEEEL